jgi:chorismate mutase-like protein
LYSRAVVLLLALGFAHAAACGEHGSAGDRIDRIVAAGVLRVGTTGDYPPFTYRRGQGTDYVGLDIELAHDLAESLGVRIEIVPTTWPTLLADFVADRFDVAAGGVSITLERQRRGLFSSPLLRDGKTPIARCDSQGRFQTLAQIDQPQVRLIVNPGGTNERFAREHAAHAQLIVQADNVTIFDRLLAGEADVMVTDATEARLQQHLHPALCALHPDQPFDFSEKALLLPRDPVFKAYVDQWLHLARERGALQQKFDRWLDYPWGLETLRSLIDARLLLGEDVARYKWNTHGAIEDPPREARVIESVLPQAVALGLPAGRATAFFRAQIEASKILQHELFARWQREGQGHFDGVPDLAGATRARFDQLTPRLLHALADNAAILADPARHAEVTAVLGALDAGRISAAAAAAATTPLVEPR